MGLGGKIVLTPLGATTHSMHGYARSHIVNTIRQPEWRARRRSNLTVVVQVTGMCNIRRRLDAAEYTR